MQRKSTINQKRMPYVEAVNSYIKEKRIPFHMPGHKQGKGVNKTLKKLWGNKVFNPNYSSPLTESHPHDILITNPGKNY